MAQMKKAFKELSCFDSISLDPTIYLRWLQTLKDFFEANECSHEESLLKATQTLEGYAH